jgi:putative endonuclease
MSDRRQRLGRGAEARALSHLRAAGLRLVARNWKAPPRPGKGGHGGELDLVMLDGDVLVFVEVRAQTRTPDGRAFAGGAAYTVGPHKQRKLAILAELFMRGREPRPKRVRFDVVAIARTGLLGWEVRWYRNAFATG